MSAMEYTQTAEPLNTELEHTHTHTHTYAHTHTHPQTHTELLLVWGLLGHASENIK